MPRSNYSATSYGNLSDAQWRATAAGQDWVKSPGEIEVNYNGYPFINFALQYFSSKLKTRLQATREVFERMVTHFTGGGNDFLDFSRKRVIEENPQESPESAKTTMRNNFIPGRDSTL